MRILSWLREKWAKLFAGRRYDLRVVDVQGDELPATVGKKELVRMTDEGQEWMAAMTCPCGCGDMIELMLLPNAKPRWDLKVDRGLPSLNPSVWRTTGCRSHFWVRRGRIHWA